MMWEDLADFGDEDGPGNTTKVAHTIGGNASIFGPDLHHSESFLEIFDLFSSKFQNHQVIFPTKKRSLTLLISNRLNKIIGNDSLNISGYSLLIKLTKTDINISITIDKSDDGYLSVGNFGQMLDLFVSLELLVKTLEEMGLAFDEVGAHADQIDIGCVGFQVQYV
jgi:hypothetical protein